MKLYLKSTSCISPVEITYFHKTFEFLINFSENNKSVQVINPNYTELLNLNTIRRISKFTKMGLHSALKCVENFEDSLDAIIVGTGIGGFRNTELFLFDMDQNCEKNLSPNPFFQSLHSSLSGNIAIALNCNCYNTTYVNKGTSFESAILDSMMFIEENPNQHILIGASDEITDEYTSIVNRTNYFERTPAVLGEGSAFFIVSGKKSENDISIIGLSILFMASANETLQSIQKLLDENNIINKDIDLILSGSSSLISDICTINSNFNNIHTINYKNYVGEYPTSSAFALWFAEKIIATQHIPMICNQPTNIKEIKVILIVNQYLNNTSIIVISK